MGTFFARIDHLSEEVGSGQLVAQCTVDQPYAQDQHENLTYNHRAGQARYLGGPLLTNVGELVEKLASRAITHTGSDLKGAMIEIAEEMSGYVATYAPLDTGALRTSGHPEVTDNGMKIYDRPPISPRERG
jgi:hypothetical protein